MNTRLLLSALSLTVMSAGGCATTPVPCSDGAKAASTLVASPGATTTVTLPSQVQWQQLNPARPASPKAGTLWGDRNGTGPTGFLLRPTDGFRSPPHIHNVSYRGVVIHGVIHNDDEKTPDMWMPGGSFWTQPKGHAHITAAKGADRLAYIEIDAGPYLVKPVEQAFDTTERPVNVDPTNLVWVDLGGASTPDRGGAQIAYLWGDPNGVDPAGIFLRLPAGTSATLRGTNATFRSVVVQGKTTYETGPEERHAMLEPGAFIATDASNMRLSCTSGAACVSYVRIDGKFAVSP